MFFVGLITEDKTFTFDFVLSEQRSLVLKGFHGKMCKLYNSKKQTYFSVQIIK